MTTYAALTDGTTTVTFASPGNGGLWYRIEDGWAPKIANLRTSAFGVGVYEDATESIPISVGGSNPAHLYANIETLKVLCDKAENWYMAKSATAVTLNFSPPGASISSAGSPVKSAVYAAHLNVPANYYGLPPSGAAWVQGMSIEMTRRAAWVYSSGSASASAASNPAAITVGFASSLSGYSHFDYRISGLHGASINSGGLQVITAPSSNYFVLQPASGVAVSGSFTHVSGSANLAYGGSVVRFTPGGTTETTLLWDAIVSGVPSTNRRYGFWAAVRNNSSTTSFLMRVGMAANTAYGTPTKSYTPYTTIGTTSLLPQIVFLGTAAIDSNPGYSIAVKASSASGTLDVNYVLAVALDDRDITVNNITGNMDFSLTPTNAYVTHSFDPRSALSPRITATGFDGVDAYSEVLTVRSYTAPFMAGSVVSVMTLGTAGSQWVVGTSSGSVRSFTATLTRYDAYNVAA